MDGKVRKRSETPKLSMHVICVPHGRALGRYPKNLLIHMSTRDVNSPFSMRLDRSCADKKLLFPINTKKVILLINYTSRKDKLYLQVTVQISQNEAPRTVNYLICLGIKI